MEHDTAVGPLLTGKVAVVTGGAGGIGRGISQAFAAHGATVAVVDIDRPRLDDTVDGLDRATAIEADVREPESARRIVDEVLERHGQIDVLVNNVGHFLFRGLPFAETTDEQWDALYAVNLQHVFRMTRAALPSMIDRGVGGSIINLSTVEAFRGIPQHPVYAAFKAGVTQFGRSLALQVGPHGIRVNDIAPDVTQSEQVPYDRFLTDEDRTKIPTWVPIGRLGGPHDTAGAAVFLASDLGSFVTGTTIHCDGGTYAAGGWFPTERENRGWTNRPHDP